jgi:hypothetical protein
MRLEKEPLTHGGFAACCRRRAAGTGEHTRPSRAGVAAGRATAPRRADRGRSSPIGPVRRRARLRGLAGPALLEGREPEEKLAPPARRGVVADAAAHPLDQPPGDVQELSTKTSPPECREAGYERRIKAAYPIHPELFDRLFKDWGTLDRFRRTRGVLRLMSAVIHSPWERRDGNLLILPGTAPIDDPQVRAGLTRYLEDDRLPMLEKDIDGPDSLAPAWGREAPAPGRFSATRRAAGALYVGSAPTLWRALPDQGAAKLTGR